MNDGRYQYEVTDISFTISKEKCGNKNVKNQHADKSIQVRFHRVNQRYFKRERNNNPPRCTLLAHDAQLHNASNPANVRGGLDGNEAPPLHASDS
jgi:hypothetical protein